MTTQILFDGRAGQGYVPIDGGFFNGIDQLAIDQEVVNPGAVTIVADPLGMLGSVWRMTLDRAIDYYATSGKCRAEISPPNSGTHSAGPPRNNSDIYMAQGVDLWMVWRFMIPGDFIFAADATQSSHDTVLIQVHDKPGTSSRVAPLHLLLVGDELQLRNSYHETIDYDRALWREKCQRDHWYSIVLNVLWDSAAPAAGYMHVWVNGRKVFREIDALNTYATNNTPGPWPKGSGYYLPHGMPANFVRNTIYHEGLQIGTEYASFTEFMAACGSADVELEPMMSRSISI